MKYANKRMVNRSGNGRFRKAQPSDIGIGGTCPVCRHFLIRVYEGDPNNIDPRGFRFRCFTCEPMTDAEKKAEEEKIASEPKFSMEMFFSKAAK
jgi:hypothetical protein